MTVDILESPRLLLRSTCESDLDVLHTIIFSDSGVMSQAFSGYCFTRQESAEFFSANFDHDGTGLRPGVLVTKDSGSVIGFAGLMPCVALGKADYEIGFVLARPHWGKGYATEIGRAQLAYGFDVAGCERLLALVSPTNSASASVLQKTGMSRHAAIEIEGRGRRNVYLLRRQA